MIEITRISLHTGSRGFVALTKHEQNTIAGEIEDFLMSKSIQSEIRVK